MKNTKVLSLLLISILLVSGCVNLKLKRNYEQSQMRDLYIKGSPFSKSEIDSEINVKLESHKYLKNQIERSFILGLFFDYLYTEICAPKYWKLRDNLNYKVKSSFLKGTKIDRTNTRKYFNVLPTVFDFVPPRGFNLSITYDTLKREAIIGKGFQDELLDSTKLSDYYFIKADIGKAPTRYEYENDTWIGSDSAIYFTNNKGAKAYMYSSIDHVYTRNLILCVKKEFYYTYFFREDGFSKYIPFKEMYYEGNDRIMYLSSRFLQYAPSCSNLWSLISANGTDDLEKTYINYFKIVLFSDYQPEDFKVINDKGGVYKYTFYSQRYDQRARLKFNKDHPNIFDIKLLND